MKIEEIMKRLDGEFVPVKDVAEVLGVTKITVVRKIKLGLLEGVDINRGGGFPNWRVRSGSVKRLLGIDDTIPA